MRVLRALTDNEGVSDDGGYTLWIVDRCSALAPEKKKRSERV